MGMEKAGGKCVFSSEWDKYAQQTYEANFKSRPHGDITKIKSEDIPDHDILCAGWPCQSFSIAGKRGGFEDTRGTLFFDVARIIKDKKPKAFLLENVKGLLSHDEGRTFEVIQQTLQDLGYTIHCKVLNSKDYGVAQNRNRIFIVGFREDVDFLFPNPSKKKVVVGDILESGVDSKYFISKKYKAFLIKHREKHKVRGAGFGYRLVDPEGVANTLTRSNSSVEANLVFVGGIGNRKRWIKDGKTNSRNFSQGNRVYSPEGISPTLCSSGGGLGAKTGLFKIKDKIRKLTPRECARLQGFPDTYKIPVSDSQAYKQFGNSVSVPVIKAIAKQIVKALSKKS